MTMRAKGVAVLAVQLVLVMSVAVKYAWERTHCPRVWTRTMQFDPEQPIRGRYLSLTLRADACGLPPSGLMTGDYNTHSSVNLGDEWKVVTVASEGKLVAKPAGNAHPELAETLWHSRYQPCEAAMLREPVEFFVPEHENGPFPLKKGEELWAEVTVPPSGPPRPVRLAVSDGKSWRVLDLR